MKKITPAIAVLLSVALGASAARAQQKSEPTFRESVEVRVMDLDVAVTDAKGQPVLDLKKENFRVRIDGKDMPIDYFTRIEAGTIHAPDLALASPDRVLAEYEKGGEAYVPRHFLIYVDSGHLSPGLRNRALDALRDFVTRLGPSDSARIVAFDRGPKVVTEWTTSKELLLDGLASMEKGVGMSRLQTELQTLRDIDNTRRALDEALAGAFVHGAGAHIGPRAVEGHRQPGDDPRAAVGQEDDPSRQRRLRVPARLCHDDLRHQRRPWEAARRALPRCRGSPSSTPATWRTSSTPSRSRANALDVTIDTMDARGLIGEGTTASNDDPLSMRMSVSFLARNDSQTGLVNLARDTGGVGLLNSNDLQKGLSRVYEDSSNYYSLGINLSKLGGVGLPRGAGGRRQAGPRRPRPARLRGPLAG